MGKIYFVRHGQTDRNIESRMNPGDINSELNNIGIEQAINAGKKAKNEGLIFDFIISSPLIRAKKTAEIIAKEIGFHGDILFDERLKEQLAGVLKNYTHTEIKKEFNINTTEEIRRLFKSKKYNKIEDIIDFKNRVSDFYNEVLIKYSDKNILLVGHSGTARMILLNSQNIDFEEAAFKMPGVPNSVIMEIK